MRPTRQTLAKAPILDRDRRTGRRLSCAKQPRLNEKSRDARGRFTDAPLYSADHAQDPRDPKLGPLYEVAEEFGGFHPYLWGFVGGKPIHNKWKTLKQIPAETAESRAMSRDLRRRGFAFVGPTICYAFMQAVGMVNDHLTTCYRHPYFKKR